MKCALSRAISIVLFHITNAIKCRLKIICNIEWKIEIEMYTVYIKLTCNNMSK